MYRKRTLTILLVAVLTLISTVSVAAAPRTVPTYPYATPVLGMAAAPEGSLLVADAGRGIVELRRTGRGDANLVAALAGVTDIAPLGRGVMWAITGGGDDATSGKLYRVSRGRVMEVADLAAFEARVNPINDVDSNPFDVALLTGGMALVADAGGNDLLVVDKRGNIDWVATLPDELVSTAHVKALIGCPNPPPADELAGLCDLPDMIPAQAVATSIVVGPDGAYYMGELKGFPGPVGKSKIWRVEPGSRHVKCGQDPEHCKVVKDGFTSIVDLNFGRNGTLYVTEIDEASFMAVELARFGLSVTQGGTVNACDISDWTCTVVATHLPIPTATAFTKDGVLYATELALVPGQAKIVQLP